MRTDDQLARDSFRRSEEWTKNAVKGETQPEIDLRLAGDEMVDGRTVVHSLSGKERNRLFLNLESGREFANLSALSGLDNPADSRGFVLFDYDHDGWQDVAMVNASAPLMNLYHNDIGQIPEARAGMIAIRFVGGNTVAASSEWSNRDGYGAVVEVELEGGVKLKREHRCGEGYAAQNSATMIVGIGDRSEAASVSVRWPSGKTFTVKDVPEGSLVSAYENRAAGAFAISQYRNVRERAVAVIPPEKKRFPLAQTGSGAGGEKIHIYTSTATWCAACIGHLPELQNLNGTGAALYGVPVDANDDAGKLAAYVEKHQPAYQMLAGIGAAEKQAVTEFFAKAMGTPNPVLPSSVITDADGNVLEVMQGIPTLSQVRKWLAAE